MNSRERLLRCIKHEPIDRVPISTYELVGWSFNSFENKEPSYRELMDLIREKTDCIYMLNPKKISKKEAEITKWNEGESTFTKVTYPNGLHSLTRKDKRVHTTWTLKHLLQDIDDIDKYLSIPYSPPEIDMSDFYRERDALGDKGIMMISISDPICEGASLFEMGDFLVYALTETDKIKYFLDALHERQMFELKEILKNDVKDVMFRICGPEYATPPYFPPRYFHDLVTKYLIEICDAINQAGALPRIHCHGKIKEVISEFALTDAVGIDPCEPPPDGDMPLSEIKKKYGKKFCIFGNIELKELENSSTERIDLLVKEAMNDAKEGSGFVLMPTAAPINTPLSQKTFENYRQMIESALKYGKY